MYATLKNITKSLIPSGLLYAIEPKLRTLVALQYKGNQHVCPVCGAQLSKFIPLRVDHLCPKCGSIERKRLLWLFLQKEVLGAKAIKMLDFSPNRYLAKALKKVLGSNYISSDFGSPHFDQRYYICAVPLADNALDIIICYHVLEHIPDDKKAMQELFRLIKPGGKLIVQVPHREADTYENAAITTPEGRLEHFGQDDHVRWYGRTDFVSRLENVGFEVKELKYAQTFDGAAQLKYGLRKDEIIFVCTKPA